MLSKILMSVVFHFFFWPLIFWLLKMNLKLWINVIYLHQTQSSLIFPWLWPIFYPLEILKFHGLAFVGPSCTFPRCQPSQGGWQLVSFPATLPPAAQITNYNHSGLEAKPHKPSLRQSHLIINPNRANGSFRRAWLLKKFFEKLLPLQITTPRCLMIR